MPRRGDCFWQGDFILGVSSVHGYPPLDICKNVIVNLFSTTVSITHRSPGLVSKQLPCLDLSPTKQNNEEDNAKQQSVKRSCETYALAAFFWDTEPCYWAWYPTLRVSLGSLGIRPLNMGTACSPETSYTNDQVTQYSKRTDRSTI
jgi:hypothetical protein